MDTFDPTLAAPISFEWIVLAMAFIAFVRWLIERVSGAPPADEHEDGTESEQDWESRSGQSTGGQAAERAESAKSATRTEIQKFFEALGGQLTEAPRPSERTAQPPPLDSYLDQARRGHSSNTPPELPPALAPKEPVLGLPGNRTQIGDKISDALSPLTADAYEPSIGTMGTKRPNARLAPLLSDREGLRAAVLLKEILGTPRGLQSMEESHRF